MKEKLECKWGSWCQYSLVYRVSSNLQVLEMEKWKGHTTMRTRRIVTVVEGLGEVGIGDKTGVR